MYLGHLHLTEHHSAVAPARFMAMGGGLCPSQPGAVVCAADTDRGQAGLIDALNSFTMTMENGRPGPMSNSTTYHLHPLG